MSVEITTEQLKQQFTDMEKLEIPKFSCGRYRIGFGGNVYWLYSTGDIEIIGKWGKSNLVEVYTPVQ